MDFQESSSPSHALQTVPLTARVPVEVDAATLLDRLVSVGLWSAGLAWLVPMMGIQMALMRFFDPRRFEPFTRIYTRGQIALTGTRWRGVVHPAVDPQRSYFFFQNHTNHLDHCTIYHITPHFKQGIELEEHFRYPVYGWFMKQRGTIPVRIGSLSKMRELTVRIRKELDKGNSLLAFPEGTRTQDGHLGAFQPGMFRVARLVGAPIVPVTVTGMYLVMRKGSYLLRPGHQVTIYCDEPIETAGLSPREIPELMARVHHTMSERLETYWASKPKGILLNKLRS
jgi:1-acyl-sn-glycerol-3-phosphate acyltransferase